MRKAVSEVIVVIMLLMIGVALVGMAYVFIMGFQEQAKSEAQQSGAESFKRMGSCLQTVSFDDSTNNLYVKNCGRYPIENISVFIDGKLSGSVPLNANQNEIRNITISASAGIHEIKLLGDYASAAISVNVTNAGPVCSDGTSYGQCSTTKPLYCSAGVLVNKCSVCGCSGGGICQADESCAAGFDFSMSAVPSSGYVLQGSSAAATVTATLISGATQPVSLSCSGLPAGASCSFAPASVSPTASSALSISTSTTTPAGTYPITITGTGGSVTRTASYSLTVTSAAPWFYPAWNYRKPVSITGSTSLLNDYQVMINLTNTTAGSDNFNFARALSDGNDTRFTWLNTSSGLEQNVSFWIENWSASGSLGNATIWVKVPNVTASSVANTTLYMYYGNPGATWNNTLGGNNTFLFFDDFSGTSLDGTKWNSLLGANGIISVTGGELKIYNAGQVGSGGRVQSIGAFALPYAYTIRERQDIIQTYNFVSFGISDVGTSFTAASGLDWSGNNAVNIFRAGSKNVETVSGGTVTSAAATDDTVYHKYDISATSAFVKFYADGIPVATSMTNIPAGSLNFAIKSLTHDAYAPSAANLIVDYLFVRSYASPEPSVLSVGAEQARP